MHDYELVQIVQDLDGMDHTEATKVLKESGLVFDLLLISVKENKGYCWKKKPLKIKSYTS